MISAFTIWTTNRKGPLFYLAQILVSINEILEKNKVFRFGVKYVCIPLGIVNTANNHKLVILKALLHPRPTSRLDAQRKRNLKQKISDFVNFIFF